MITGKENATIVCGQHGRHLELYHIYEVEYRNCSIHTKTMQWYSRLITTANSTSKLNQTLIPIYEVPTKKLALHPSTRDLRTLKERTLLNMDQQWLSLPESTTTASIWTLMSSPILIIMVILGYLIYRKNRNLQGTEAWFPNWNGLTIEIPMSPRSSVTN